MKSLPARTSELRANLVELGDSPTHHKVLEGMAQSMDRAYGENYASRTVRILMRDLTRHARLSELYTMSTDMMDLIEHASKSMPAQVMVETDLPSEFGLLHLPRPLQITDIRLDKMWVSEIMWSRVMTDPMDYRRGSDSNLGVRILVFTRFGGEHDRVAHWLGNEQTAKMRAQVPEMSLLFSRELDFNDPAQMVTCVDEGITKADRARYTYDYINIVGDLTLNQRKAMRDTLPIVEIRDGEPVFRWNGHLYKYTPDPFVQFLKSYFHFCKSTLTQMEHEYPPRSMGKWLRRLQLPESPVTVVALRKTKHDGHTGHHWELTYRYVRRGHWRAQWYGSGDHKYQQHIWIAPTIVGPDDGPLRVRDVVNVVVR